MSDKSQVFLECLGLELKGFYIPPFKLEKGFVVRLWVDNSISDFHSFIKTFSCVLCRKTTDSKIILADSFYEVKKIKENYLQKTFFPKTVKEYLNKKGIEINKEQLTVLQSFDIEINVKLKNLMFRQLRLLEIFTTFEQHNNVILKYFTLGPVEEKQLTNYIEKQILIGKTVVAFDMLSYISDIYSHDNFINIKIEKAV